MIARLRGEVFKDETILGEQVLRMICSRQFNLMLIK